MSPADLSAEIRSLRNLRVLCLRSGGDNAGLEELLAAATRDLDWQITTLRPDLARLCERQAFETDHNAVAAIDALIRECEIVSGVTAGRILLVGGSDLGRGFSAPDVAVNESAVSRAVLSDNTEAFRILRRMFVHARDTVAEAKPDLVLFGGRADCWAYVFRLIARRMDIDALSLRRSRLWEGRCYLTRDIGGLNLAAHTGVVEKRTVHASVSTKAQDHIAQGRLDLSPDDATDTGAVDSRTLYLALKEDPSEAPDAQSPFWANQNYVAELVCSAMPAGYKLLVHEHPANAGRRPSNYHRNLARLPNVVLVNSSEPAQSHMARASLVITDDSPTGWQALLLGRPVVILADNFYSASGVAHRVYDPEELASTVVHTLASTPVRDAKRESRALAWLLDAEWETTAPIDNPVEVLKLLKFALCKPTTAKRIAVAAIRSEPAEDVSALSGTASAEHSALQARRALAVLPLGNKDLGKYLTGLMTAGKNRFGWTVSVLSSTADTGSFAKLVAPHGEIFVQPPLLKEADWERDAHQVNEIDRAIRDAEILTGLPIGRVILAAGHSIGRAYSVPFHYFNRYPVLLQVLRDNEEPHRIARRLFRFADKMLECDKPDFLFFFHWGTPLNLLTWLAAQRRRIPCVVLRPSKIWPDQAFLTTDRLMWNSRAGDVARFKVKSQMPASEAAREKIETFRTQPVMIKYIATKWSSRMNRGFFRWHKQYVRIVMTQIANRFRGQDRSAVEGAVARLIRYYRTLFLSWYQQRLFTTFEPDALAGMKYVYFPLHKEAELAQTFQASTWHDQRQTVRTLASTLPFGYRLLIREHRLNYGRRRTLAYRELAQLPNVTLLDPFDSQYKYLQHADLVVTENGSTGWEALMLKRRTLLLAEHTFYSGSGLGRTVTNPDELNAAVLELLSNPPVADDSAHDHALAAMIDAEFETTFPMNQAGMPACLDMLEAHLGPLLRSQNAAGTAIALADRQVGRPAIEQAAL